MKYLDFATDHDGITGLAVSLFGAEGLPAGADRIPVDMLEPAVGYLREKRGTTRHEHGQHLRGTGGVGGDRKLDRGGAMTYEI